MAEKTKKVDIKEMERKLSEYIFGALVGSDNRISPLILIETLRKVERLNLGVLGFHLTLVSKDDMSKAFGVGVSEERDRASVGSWPVNVASEEQDKEDCSFYDGGRDQ